MRTYMPRVECCARCIAQNLALSGNTLKTLKTVHAMFDRRPELTPVDAVTRYGYEPQRVAVWIYWEALQLLRKGVPFYGPPDERQKAELEKRVIGSDTKGSQGFRWRPAARFPWRSREFCCSDDRER